MLGEGSMKRSESGIKKLAATLMQLVMTPRSSTAAPMGCYGTRAVCSGENEQASWYNPCMVWCMYLGGAKRHEQQCATRWAALLWITEERQTCW
jgi:hypothetical protein